MKYRRVVARYAYDGEGWWPTQNHDDRVPPTDLGDILRSPEFKAFLDGPEMRQWVRREKKLMRDRSYAKNAVDEIRKEAPLLLDQFRRIEKN